MTRRELSMFIIFSDTYTCPNIVLKKFKPIPIKIGFIMNFQICTKIGPKSLYYSTVILVRFHQKWLRKNSRFLYFFLIRIHVLILCRKFKPIPIKIGFFMNFYSCSIIGPKSLYYSTVILAKFRKKMDRREFSVFIIFSETYTCPYAV